MTTKHVDQIRPTEAPPAAGFPAEAVEDARLSPTSEAPLRAIRPLALGAVSFGLLGGIFYWWTPLGIVLSLTGMLLGFIACINAPPRSGIRSVAVIGILLSAAFLVLDIAIAVQGLEWVQFGPLR
jgi:hypothetical protein